MSCNKNYSNQIDIESKKRFSNTFNVPNNDINNFIFLLRKVVYPYEYMDDWVKFNETSLPEKEEFNRNLNMEYGRYYTCKLHVCKNSFLIHFFKAWLLANILEKCV